MADSNTNCSATSRKDANKQGLKYYFTGKPCKHGHVSKRHAHNSVCVECSSLNSKRWSKINNARCAKNMREWRRKNPEKEKINSDRANRAHYERHRDKVLEAGRLYYLKNREKRSAYERARRKSVGDMLREKNRNWKRNNRDKANALERNREARKRKSGGAHTADDIRSILNAQFGKCAYCRTKFGKKYHVDHIIAVSRGGTNNRRNLQILCVPCNLAKGARDPIVHAQTLGMLL